MRLHTTSSTVDGDPEEDGASLDALVDGDVSTAWCHDEVNDGSIVAVDVRLHVESPQENELLDGSSPHYIGLGLALGDRYGRRDRIDQLRVSSCDRDVPALGFVLNGEQHESDMSLLYFDDAYQILGDDGEAFDPNLEIARAFGRPSSTTTAGREADPCLRITIERTTRMLGDAGVCIGEVALLTYW